jgi:hypothetical protein
LNWQLTTGHFVTTGWRTTIFFVLLTAAATYPLINVFDPALPDFDDAQFSVWRLSWVAHQLPRDPMHLFDANIFFPERRVLAYSDAMLLLGVAGAPLVWLGVHAVVVHNLLLLAAIAASGMAAWALSLRLTGDRRAALAAGVVFSLAPYRFAHIGHLELQWAAFVPLTLLVLHRGGTSDQANPWRQGVLAGVLVALQGLSSLYYVAYSSLLLLVWAVLTLLLVAKKSRRLLHILGVAAVTASLLLAPYVAVYAATRTTLGARSSDEIRQFSALPSDYLRVSAASRVLPQRSQEGQDERSLYPGVTAVALALIALAFGRGAARLIYAAVTVLAFDLSLGVNGFAYPLLLRLAPALSSLRAPARFGLFVMLGVGVLASIGAHELRQRLPARLKSAIVPAVLALMLIEYWCAPLSTRRVPLQPANVHRWLAAQAPAVVLEIPVPTPGTLWGSETSYQFMSIYHWQSLVNGYSGFAPVSYFRTLEIIDARNSAEVSDRLQTIGVDYVVLHQRLLGPARLAEMVSFFSTLPAALPPQSFVDPDDPAVVIPIAN